MHLLEQMLRQSFHLQLGRTEASIYTHISLRALLQCSHSVSLSLTSTHHNQSCLSDSAAISTTCITCILWQQNYTNSLFIPSLESGRRAGRTCASLVTMVRLHLNATRTTSQLSEDEFVETTQSCSSRCAHLPFISFLNVHQ